MIYPEVFPKDRENEFSEKKVFDRLKKVSDKFDIFYSRRFVSNNLYSKPQYELDFIIAKPGVALVCLEVKGGLIQFNGDSGIWTQNGFPMAKNPVDQVTSAAKSILRTNSSIIGNMPIGWALGFPDCDIRNKQIFPNSISEHQVLDQLSLLHPEHSLPLLFEFIQRQFPEKNGVGKRQYDKFKSQLLRSIGFVQILSTKFKYDEERFVELTNHQLSLFNRISSNKKIIVNGPAGSGKTIVAKTAAQDFLNEGKKVLFMCFNRTLANKIRYEFDRYEKNVEVITFHSFARKIIEKYNKNWWHKNSNKTDEFWNLDVPVKLEECLQFFHEKFDILIIDEGQDFKELWFELIFSLINPDGHQLIFLDEMQNIFQHYSEIPDQDSFFKYSLLENCRNTKNIVNYLSALINREIRCFEEAPIGENIINKTFLTQEEERKFLLDEIKNLIGTHNIDPNQILVLINSPKTESCLADITKTGKLPIKALDRQGRMESNSINYTTINTYKGLEVDVLFVVDIDQIPHNKKLEKLYTEASRAKHKLYLLSV